jgi:hypothetical protein
MKRLTLLVSLLLTTIIAHADRLGQEATITCHPAWECESGQEPGASEKLLHTLKYVPKDGRNATIMLSIMPNDIPGSIVTDLDSLKRFNRMSASPYLTDVSNPPPVSTLKISNGIALAMTNVDPSLIGKPVPPGEYRIATVVSVLLGRKVLIHCTIYYDELDSTDYQEALQILQSAALTANQAATATAI